jgi:hypothetical protein
MNCFAAYKSSEVRRFRFGFVMTLLLLLFHSTPARGQTASVGSAEPLMIGVEPGFGFRMLKREVLFEDLDEDQVGQLEVISNERPDVYSVETHRRGLTLIELSAAAPEVVGFKVRGKRRDGPGWIERSVQVLSQQPRRPQGPVRPLLILLTHGFAFWGNEMTEWPGEAARAFERSARRLGLPAINGNLVPVSLDAVERVPGGHRSALLGAWKGSRDVLALDWRDASNNGVTPLDIQSEEHHRHVERAAVAQRRLVDAWIADRQAAGFQKVDLLVVGHSFGTMVSREFIQRLNATPAAAAIENLKCVWLDPVAVEADNRAAGPRANDQRHWQNPEFQGLVSSVSSYVQTDWPILWYLSPIDDELEAHTPLDGFWGGGPAGFFNGMVRVFRMDQGRLIERGRYRHLREEGRPAQGDLRDVASLPEGRWASVDDRGQVRVVNADLSERLAFRGEPRSTGMAVSVDGTRLAILSREPGQISVFSAADGRVINRVAVSGVRRVAAGATGSWVVGTTDGAIGRITSDGRLVDRSKLFAGAIGALTVDPQSERWLVGSLRGELALLTSGRVQNRLTLSNRAPVRSVVALGDGRVVFAAGKRAWATRPDAAGGFGPLTPVLSSEEPVTAVAVTPDGNVAIAGGDRWLRMLRPSDWRELSREGGGSSMLPIRRLAVARTGEIAVLPDDLDGGPVADYNCNGLVREHTGFWDRQKPGGAHRSVPIGYIREIVDRDREPFLWRRFVPDLDRPSRLQTPYIGAVATGMPVVVTNQISDLLLWEGSAPQVIPLTNLFTLPGACEVQLHVSHPGAVTATLDSQALTLAAVRIPAVRSARVRVTAANELGEAERQLQIQVVNDVLRDVPAISNGVVRVTTSLRRAEAVLASVNAATLDASAAFGRIQRGRGSLDTNRLAVLPQRIATQTNALVVRSRAQLELSRGVVAARDRVQLLERNLDSAAKALNDAERSRLAAEQRLALARQRLRQATNANRAALQREVQQAERELGLTEATVKAARRERDRIRQQRDEATSTLRIAENKALDGERQLAALNAELSKLVAEHASLRAAAAQLLADWDSGVRAHASAQQSLLGARAEIAGVRRAILELVETVDGWRSLLGSRHAEAQRAVQRLRQGELDRVSRLESTRSREFSSVQEQRQNLERWINAVRSILSR